MGTAELLSVARGDAPADLVLKNGRIVNVFSGEIEPADIAIHGDRIAGVGAGYFGNVEHELKGSFVAPGLIDAHVHIESSLCLPAEFARAVVPRGVTTVVADPHEVANVAGAAGVRFMADASCDLPLRVILMAPSCVPATELATAGQRLTGDDLLQLLREGVVHGLAEVMNFPGVIGGDHDVLEKLAAFGGRPVDGHCPGVSGKALNAYIAAGPRSDHEAIEAAEAREKLARGLYVLIREASNARNLDALLPIVTDSNSRRICFCSDDRHAADLLNEGSIDDMIRRAIAFGIDPVSAFRMATLNTAECFGLRDRGAISPGRLADLIVFEDLNAPVARFVYVGGQRIDDKTRLPKVPVRDPPTALTQSFKVETAALDLAVHGSPGQIRVIGCMPDQLVTRHRLDLPNVVDGQVVADMKRDILKMAVVERHGKGGRVGIGFIHGFGLKSGAIAGTIAHDHHNLVLIGCDDASMRAAAGAVQQMDGGLVVADGGAVIAGLPLPIAGLMSSEDIQFVSVAYLGLIEAARARGCTLRDPFMAMSFMALEVIPALKLTDRGLVDVEAFQHVNLFV